MTTEVLQAQTAAAQEAARLLVGDLDEWGVPGHPVALVRTPTGPRPALVLAPQDVVDPATYGVVWAATPEPGPLRRIETFHEGLWPFQIVPWRLARMKDDGTVYSTHLRRVAADTGIPPRATYYELQELIEHVAEEVEVERAVLDYSLWRSRADSR